MENETEMDWKNEIEFFFFRDKSFLPPFLLFAFFFAFFCLRYLMGFSVWIFFVMLDRYSIFVFLSPPCSEKKIRFRWMMNYSLENMIAFWV